MSERDFQEEFISVSRVYSALSPITSGVKVVLLDACRNSGLKSATRSLSKGLAPMDADSGMIVGFATAPGKVALDGSGRNSPYLLGLAQAIRTARAKAERAASSIEFVLKETRKNVARATQRKQLPMYESELEANLYFKTATQ
jgi:uncharacterized caspase-like protein